MYAAAPTVTYASAPEDTCASTLVAEAPASYVEPQLNTTEVAKIAWARPNLGRMRHPHAVQEAARCASSVESRLFWATAAREAAHMRARDLGASRVRPARP